MTSPPPVILPRSYSMPTRKAGALLAGYGIRCRRAPGPGMRTHGAGSVPSRYIVWTSLAPFSGRLQGLTTFASACLRTISRIGSISSAPETYATVNGLNFSIVDMFLTFCVDYRVKSLMCVCHGKNRDTRTSFSPIVSGAACSSHEGIRSEESTDGTATYL